MVNRSKIKICGVTNKKDALKLAEYDVFALGFIITEKQIPSRIDLNLAAKIISQLPARVKAVVGVANLPSQEIIKICQKTKPDIVQIQKGGNLAEIAKIKTRLPQIKVWKTVFTNSPLDLKMIAKFEKAVDSILIHSQEKEWPKGKKIAQSLKKPFIIAGGLDLKNIKKAIDYFQPFAVDLIRGVETTPGKKDFVKVEELVRLVRG